MASGHSDEIEETQQRTAIAYHEAGHAVAAHCLGYRLLSVSIKETPTGPDEPPGRVRGYVCLDDTSIRSKEPHEISINRARIAMAGVIAGSIHAGSRYRDYDWVEFGGRAAAGDDDFEEMKRFLEDAGIPNEKQRQPYLRLRAITRRLLATPRNWAAVEAIVQALLNEKTLSGPEAIALVENARPTIR